MQSFTDLMNDLGELLNTEIHPDLNLSCCLMINDSLKVQIEMSTTGEEILLASFVVELPPGRFREEVLRDALKANHQSDLNHGVLSYVKNHNALTLFQTIHAHGLSANDLYKYLSLFVERAKGWKDAINAGKTHPTDSGEVPQSREGQGSSLFGFK